MFLAAEGLGLQHFGLAMPTLEEIFLRVTSAGATGGADAPADSKPANGHPDGAVPPTGRSVSAATNGHANGHANGNAEDTGAQKPAPSVAKTASPAAKGRQGQRQTSGEMRRQLQTADPATAAAAERSSGPRALVAFREMYRKRALIASRDKKGAVFTLLIPVLAVAFVLVRLQCLPLDSYIELAMLVGIVHYPGQTI